MNDEQLKARIEASIKRHRKAIKKLQARIAQSTAVGNAKEADFLWRRECEHTVIIIALESILGI